MTSHRRAVPLRAVLRARMAWLLRTTMMTAPTDFALREKLAPGTHMLDVHGIAASAVQTELLYAMGTEPEDEDGCRRLSRNKNTASETAATGMQATLLENAIGTQLFVAGGVADAVEVA